MFNHLTLLCNCLLSPPFYCRPLCVMWQQQGVKNVIGINKMLFLLVEIVSSTALSTKESRMNCKAQIDRIFVVCFSTTDLLCLLPSLWLTLWFLSSTSWAAGLDYFYVGCDMTGPRQSGGSNKCCKWSCEFSATRGLSLYNMPLTKRWHSLR